MKLLNLGISLTTKPLAEKLRVQDMSKIVTAAAQLAIDQLPFHIGECSVAYIKDMGHLIAVKEWEPNCDGEELNSAGLQFMVFLFTCVSTLSNL